MHEARERIEMLRRLLSLLPIETLDGYEHPELVDVIFRKTIAYQPTGKWSENAATVLDFGGGCGLHYKEANLNAKWAVVETPAMVARARELETDQLRFFTRIEDAGLWLGDIDLMHSNGAIQYVPDPIRTIRELCSIGAKQMLWHRLLIGDGKKRTQVSRLTDNGPGHIPQIHKRVAYEETPINESEFLKAHHLYSLTSRGADWFRFSARALPE